MGTLRLGLRLYLCAVYLACLALVAGSLATLTPPGREPQAMLQDLATFMVLAYLGVRTTLHVRGSVTQNLSTSVHIAAILLFPPPFPMLIAFLVELVSQALHAPIPLFKRAFNICHSTLTVGLSSLILSRVTAPTAILRPGHVMAAVPLLGLLIGVYYLLDTGKMLIVLSLAERRAPWHVWRQTYRRTLLPELAASTIGILGAIAWQYDPLSLALLVLPVVALRVAIRAIAAEDRAIALHRRSEQLEVVLAAGEHLGLQHTPVDLLQTVADAARGLVGASTAVAYLRDGEDSVTLRRVAVVPRDAARVGAERILIPAPRSGIGEEVDDAGRTVLVPLEQDGAGVLGLLLLAEVPDKLSQHDRDVLTILATQAAIALENAQLHERALAQASEDGLTGLLNHRTFQTRLEEEVERARRAERPLALMMVDLDNFGTVNNTYGHQIGDATLLAVATALRESARATDIAARYGGDEFAVILPSTTMADALSVAERIHSAIAALEVAGGGVVVRIDASVGVAALPLHARTREDLIRAADQAAYAAKHAGKGRVGRPEDATLLLEQDPSRLASMLEHANMATVEALAAAVDAKDSYTRGHSQRVSAYAVAMAEAMGLPAAEVARVRLAGLLHDVGKIGVPDAILTKPGTLSAEETALLQQHSVIGERMLSAVPFLREILPAVRHHHERWDGLGYPDALAGDAIPRDAAILMVADSFDAMTSSRTYRPALPLSEARRRMRENSGKQFNPRVVVAFEQALDDGTLVPLSPGNTKLLNPDLATQVAARAS